MRGSLLENDLILGYPYGPTNEKRYVFLLDRVSRALNVPRFSEIRTLPFQCERDRSKEAIP